VRGLGRAVDDGDVLDLVQGLVNVRDLEAFKDSEYAVSVVKIVVD
jgi:hypothetical protein